MLCAVPSCSQDGCRKSTTPITLQRDVLSCKSSTTCRVAHEAYTHYACRTSPCHASATAANTSIFVTPHPPGNEAYTESDHDALSEPPSLALVAAARPPAEPPAAAQAPAAPPADAALHCRQKHAGLDSDLVRHLVLITSSQLHNICNRRAKHPWHTVPRPGGTCVSCVLCG